MWVMLLDRQRLRNALRKRARRANQNFAEVQLRRQNQVQRQNNLRRNELPQAGCSCMYVCMLWIFIQDSFFSSLGEQVFGMTRLWLELTTFRSGGEHSTFTLPVGS